MDKQVLETFFAVMKQSFADIKPIDILDIVLLSLIFFGVYSFLRDRRASNLISGIVVLLIGYAVAFVLGMHAISFLLRSVFGVGAIALVVIFQSEIRTALEKMGDRPWRGLRTLGESKDLEATLSLIDAICDAAENMSKPDQKTGEYVGALIVIERTTKLGDIINAGVEIDARPSSTLFQGIFYKGAPMHDGAVIIRNRRVAAAGCVLPLTGDNDIDQELGLRHRAALGMSEVSDAIIIVISEQTGTISVASDGTLTREYSLMGLRNVLKDKLIGRRDIELDGIV